LRWVGINPFFQSRGFQEFIWGSYLLPQKGFKRARGLERIQGFRITIISLRGGWERKPLLYLRRRRFLIWEHIGQRGGVKRRLLGFVPSLRFFLSEIGAPFFDKGFTSGPKKIF